MLLEQVALWTNRSLNRVQSDRIWIVYTLFRSIWQQINRERAITRFFLVDDLQTLPPPFPLKKSGQIGFLV